MDAGELLILGPSFQQEWTCVSGQSCGVSLNEHRWSLGQLQSHLLVLETCGVSAFPESWPSAFLEGSNATQFGPDFFVAGRVSAPGGQYRVCWCGSVTNGTWSTCDIAEDFAADIGALEILGPQPFYQHFTCYSGQECSFNLQSDHFGLIRVLDTCGTTSIPRLASETNQLVDTTVASGGEYRLCWCADLSSTNFSSRCVLGQDYRIDAGTLTLLGLDPLNQDQTCVSGAKCVLNTFSGVGLESFQLLALSTCGVDLPAFEEVLEVERHWANQTMTSWEVLGTGGGDYRLCWCAKSSEVSSFCSRPSSFKVDSGHLAVIGPLLGQDRTCVSGETCSLDSLLGVGLQSDDDISIRSSCDGGAVPDRFMQSVPLLSYTGTWRTWSASWGTTRSSAAGGSYRLCWRATAARGASSANISSSLNADWVDFGSFTLMGSSPWGPSGVSAAPCRCHVDALVCWCWRLDRTLRTLHSRKWKTRLL